MSSSHQDPGLVALLSPVNPVATSVLLLQLLVLPLLLLLPLAYRHWGPAGPVRCSVPPKYRPPYIRHSQSQTGLGFPKVPESTLRSRGKPYPAPLENVPTGHSHTVLLCVNAVDYAF